MKKIVIFGVGLIGGSVALAIKKASGLKLNPIIVGVGRSTRSLEDALNLGVIDKATSDIKLALEGADLVLIATPVAQIPTILSSIKPHINYNTVITDAGSTKSDVLQYAEEILGQQCRQFVGGHPIAGAEKSGVNAASAKLFINKNVVLTPTSFTSQHAISCVTQLWEICGAQVCQIPAGTHDRIFATVSHLPHLLAFALVNSIASRPNAAQLFSFAASGFRDFTRIAGSNPEMWRDISLANKTALLSELKIYETEISSLKILLENEDSDGLEALFQRASNARNAWAESQKP